MLILPHVQRSQQKNAINHFLFIRLTRSCVIKIIFRLDFFPKYYSSRYLNVQAIRTLLVTIFKFSVYPNIVRLNDHLLTPLAFTKLRPLSKDLSLETFESKRSFSFIIQLSHWNIPFYSKDKEKWTKVRTLRFAAATLISNFQLRSLRFFYLTIKWYGNYTSNNHVLITSLCRHLRASYL